MDINGLLNTLLVSDTQSLGIAEIAVTLTIPFFLMIPVVLFYKRTATLASVGIGFISSLLMFAPITSIITLLIGSNIARAFGLVAALSIIRFRTALKSPLDSIFMFWSLAVGMATGTGYYLAAVMIVLFGMMFMFIISYFRLEEINFETSLLKVEVAKDMGDSEILQLEDELSKSVRSFKKINSSYNSQGSHKTFTYNISLKTSDNPRSVEKQISEITGVDKVKMLTSDAGLFL